MIRSRLFTLLAALGAAFALSAPALADDVVNVAIGQKGPWDSMIVQQGIDQGIFKREKVEVHAVYTAGGPDTIQAVATGSADFGFTAGTTAVIAAFAKGAPIRIVSAEMTGSPDIYFYVKAESPIKSFADLNGKTVGVSRPGSSTYITARTLADQFKVQPNLVATGEMAATLTQVMSGQIDAGWAAVPINLDQVAAKKIRIVARGSEASALNGQTIRVNFANATFLKDKRDTAQRFFKAYQETMDWMKANTAQAVANYARYNGMPLNEAKEVPGFIPWSAIALYPVRGFDRSVADALEYKLIPKPLDADQQKSIFEYLAH